MEIRFPILRGRRLDDLRLEDPGSPFFGVALVLSRRMQIIEDLRARGYSVTGRRSWASAPSRTAKTRTGQRITSRSRARSQLNYRGSGTVTPISTATNKAGKEIKVGPTASAIAITPNGRTAYVVSEGSDTVTPISTATNMAGKPIKIPHSSSYSPSGYPGQTLILSTPNGKTVYVASQSAGTVTPISTATTTVGKSIKVGKDPFALAITPNGKVVEVVNQASDTVTPIRTATNTAGQPIPVGSTPWAIAITPNGKNAYVVNNGSGTVTPISIVTGRAGKAISVGNSPVSIAITR